MSARLFEPRLREFLTCSPEIEYVAFAMDEIDVWRVADLLMKECREEAVFVASKRADAMLEQGNTEGVTTWLKVVKAIETLQRKGPAAGEAVN